MPTMEAWEINRDSAGECDGSIDSYGRCRAWSDPNLWVTQSQTVNGHQIQIDRSGVGHAWRNIDRDDMPANVAEEIECEMIDGNKDECSDYIASNGLHYRW